MDCPGSVNDAVAWRYTKLYRQIESGKFPKQFWIAGDAAYGCSEAILSPFPGKLLPQEKDAFNFHLSQLRINIECAFGMLVNRWGILWKPMRCPLHKVPKVVGVCMKLHNLIIDRHNEMDATHEACDDVIEYATVRLNNGQLRNVKKTFHTPRFNKRGAPIEMQEIAAQSPFGIISSIHCSTRPIDSTDIS
jgi:hypothetical protein